MPKWINLIPATQTLYFRYAQELALKGVPCSYQNGHLMVPDIFICKATEWAKSLEAKKEE
jgi:hypothetical protein